eukprot:m.468792 g.468792  ORF g.468792 m.468792 type:complete len:121 (+) comp21647_c1_seq5:26-388(+)
MSTYLTPWFHTVGHPLVLQSNGEHATVYASCVQPLDYPCAPGIISVSVFLPVCGIGGIADSNAAVGGASILHVEHRTAVVVLELGELRRGDVAVDAAARHLKRRCNLHTYHAVCTITTDM